MSATDTDATTAFDSDPVLEITDAALAQVLELRDKEQDGEALGLRIEITGAQGPDFVYDLAFATADEAVPGDALHELDDFFVIVPQDSVADMRGATLDLPAAEGQGGLVLRNPNKPNPLVGPAVELTGTVEERVRQLLDESINPALAAHGGFAGLERIEGAKAFVTMGGGCQGCAVSAMTLRDGSQLVTVGNVPEIEEVLALTDHGSGDNPYY